MPPARSGSPNFTDAVFGTFLTIGTTGDINVHARSYVLLMLAVWLWLLAFTRRCFGDIDLEDYENAYIAQRDISSSIPVDQLTSFGISLNSIILDRIGYSNASLSYVDLFLRYKTSMFVLDLYWNDATQKWQLCPAPFPENVTSDMSNPVSISWNGHSYTCQPSFTINQFLSTFQSYLSRTNIRYEANVIQFAFNLKSISPNQTNSSHNATKVSDSYKSAFREVGNATLQDSLSPILTYLFSPSDYESVASSLSQDTSQTFYYSSFPTQYELMYSLYKRVLPFVLSNELSNSSTYNLDSQDYNLLFFPHDFDFAPFVTNFGNETLENEIEHIYSHSDSSATFGEIVNGSQFRMAIDTDEIPFSNDTISQYLKSGFTTILNASDYGYEEDYSEGDAIRQILHDFIPVSYWSWASGEPVVFSRNETHRDIRNESWYSSSATQRAYQCVSIGQTGWSLQNCYDEMRWACKNNSDPFSWEISASKSTFFQFSKAECPAGFTVGVPKSSIEQFSLLSLLRSRNIGIPVWIDLNDITINGCYVSGGPYALCPYREVVTTRSFIKSLAPSSLVALFILFLVFCEKFSTTPIHSNRRRHWRKTITNYYEENDYEGVPL